MFVGRTLTDKTFRFKSRVWFSKPYNAQRLHLFWKTTVWMFGDEIQRVTGRKDEYHEVDEFICNGCRFDHKELLIGLLKDQEHSKRFGYQPK
jgi:NADH-quinone oxidoreductase subunit G